MKRRRINQNLPRNLYRTKKGARYYYSYRNPQTGKDTGMGSDSTRAIAAAKVLNEKLLPPPDGLFDRVIGGTYRVDRWLEEYYPIFKKRGMSIESPKARKSQIKRIRAAFGKRELSALQHDVKGLADFLRAIEKDEGKARTAQQVRTALIDIFDEAIRSGIIENNPAKITRNPRIIVTRARLSLEDFQAILAQAEGMAPWVANSMLLGLLTGQRRTDIANMRFKDVRDDWLHVIQRKTGAPVRLATALRLDAINMSVADAVARCRDRVVSPHLLHHSKNRAGRKLGSAISPPSISHAFAEARDKAGLSWEGSPPSFHELRSLSARLYKKQAVDAQALLGHSDQATTRKYTDPKGTEWIEVSAS